MLVTGRRRSLTQTKLVTEAIRAEVCLDPRLRDEYSTFFVVVHPSGTFYISQSVAALDKLIYFLKMCGIDTAQLTSEYVALRCQTRSFLGISVYDPVKWIHYSNVETGKENKYIRMRQWLTEEHMRTSAKPILRGNFTGGKLIPASHLGFQEIVKSNGKTARFIFPLQHVPNFLVQWMVDFPL